jgi:hypothetical protein
MSAIVDLDEEEAVLCSRCRVEYVKSSKVGFCRACKTQWQREYRARKAAGEVTPRYMDMRERITRRVEHDENGCWVWQGSTSGKGYGYLRVNGRSNYAHRVSYEAFVGPIPEGEVIDHLCRNARCCNPSHLEPVSTSVNVQRGLRGGLRGGNRRSG